MPIIPRFIQIHSLHSYPAALLNRDDSGLAKRMQFGDAVRTRVSSQSLKRHWRVADDEFALQNIEGAARAIRSRNVVERKVMDPLRESGDFSDDILKAVGEAFNVGVYGDKGTTEQGRQPLLLGLPEVEYLQKKARAICADSAGDAKAAENAAKLLFTAARRNEERDNFQTFRTQTELPGGLIGALFGRMVTSDPDANIDAAIHVAHALTVHAEESESDYFSVVDDLQREDEDAGAAHIGDAELTAGLFYGYVVVDVPGLVSNLEGCEGRDWLAYGTDREMAAKVVEHLLHLIATVSPGAKLGSTAPYAYADLMLVEAGSRQPRSLSNAFRGRVAAQMDKATEAMSKHLGKLDKAYCAREARRVMSVDGCEMPKADCVSMDELAAWAADSIRKGEAV